METHDTPAGRLTEAIVDKKLADLQATDRELTRRLAEMFASSGFGPTVGVIEAQRNFAARTLRIKALLNGAGHLVPDPPPAGATEAEIRLEQADVAAAIKLLQRERELLVAAASAEFARAHEAEWREIAGDLFVACAAVQRLSERAEEFAKRAAGSWLPLTRLVIGAEVQFQSGDRLETALKAAIADGLVTEQELRKAGNAKRG